MIYLKSSLDRGGTPVLGQQAGVDVQGPKPRDVQEPLGQYVAICGGDAEVRLQAYQLLQEVLLPACNTFLLAHLAFAFH